MQTLYDLLGALPEDSAEDLRLAFRRAAKATHPDIHTEDEDAPERFRRLVRANDILSDADQRAVYDHLLALTVARPKPRARVLHFVSEALMMLFLSGASIGGYILLQNLSQASVAPAAVAETAAPRAVAIVATTIPLEDLYFPAHQAEAERVEPAGPPSAGDTTVATVAPMTEADDVAVETVPEKVAETVAAPATDAVVAADAVVPRDAKPDPVMVKDATPDPAVAMDAKSHRAQGARAYRDGDLRGAIGHFDQAIRLDPNSADAYVDRGIALYRMHEFERAFADISRAKRLGKTTPATSAPAGASKEKTAAMSGNN